MECDVFISYSRKDKVSAEQLCAELDKAGISYWIDREIHSSANFLTEISQRIIACKVVIFIASDSSAKSIWTQKEILFAIKHDKTIIPYRINKFSFDSNNELDFVFTNVQWVDDIKDVVVDVHKICYNQQQTTNNIPTIRLPFYKKSFKLLLFCCTLFIVAVVVYVAISCFRVENVATEEKHDEFTNNKQTIIEEFERQNELPVYDRVDIVDLIEKFIIDESADVNIVSWSVFKDFTKKRQLIPLSNGLEWIDTDFAACKLEFIAKLIHDGQNLDSDIYGQSKVQEISLYGARSGAYVLVISSGSIASYDIGEVCDNIIQDLGFSRWTDLYFGGGIHYNIYKKNNYWLLEILSGGTGGYFYDWIITNDKTAIADYIEKVENEESFSRYLKMALSISGDDYPRRYGWENATVFDRPELKGDIETLVVEHKETGQHCKDFYKFNNRGDVISHTSYNQTGALDYTTEFKYDYPNNFVRELFHDKDGITEHESHYIDTESFLLSNHLSEYKYDDKGTITEEIKKYDYIQTRHFYKYDMSGNIISEVIKQVDQPTITIEYKYDEKGNVIQLNRTPGRFSDSSLTTYTYTYR